MTFSDIRNSHILVQLQKYSTSICSATNCHIGFEYIKLAQQNLRKFRKISYFCKNQDKFSQKYENEQVRPISTSKEAKKNRYVVTSCGTGLSGLCHAPSSIRTLSCLTVFPTFFVQSGGGEILRNIP